MEVLLTAEENDNQKSETVNLLRSRPASNWLIALLASLIFLLGCLGGFTIGWLSHGLLFHNSVLVDAVPQVSIGSNVEVFGSYAQFMGPPPSDNSREPAWDSLLPKGLGYVSSAETNYNISTVGAFHQLHCLYTLRRIYYATVTEAQEKSQKGHTLAPFDNGVERPQHVEHCFEYLRQALMCSADSSLEPFEVKGAGFPGMGFPRQCKDYAALKKYAEQHRVMDAQGFVYEKPDVRGHGSS